VPYVITKIMLRANFRDAFPSILGAHASCVLPPRWEVERSGVTLLTFPLNVIM
jgi:hypothetical protein